MKIRLRHYRFQQYSKHTTVGLTYTREEFPSHGNVKYDLSLSYGKGCAYIEVERKL